MGAWGIQAVPAAAAAQTRYVATSGDDSENDCLDQAHPCLTIQYAVNQADPGDTVSIAQGTYDESVHIRKSLTLLGAGSTGAGRSTIDGDNDPSDPSIWIDGVDTDGPPHVTIRDLDVSGNTAAGGIVVDDGIATVESSAVSNNAENGLLLETGQRPDARTVRQADEIVPSATLTDVTLSGNGPTQGRGAGVLVDAGAVSVDHSVISQNGDGGVVVEDGSAAVDTSTIDANIGAGVVVDGEGTKAILTNSTVSHTTPFTATESVEDFGGGVLVFPGGRASVDTSTLFGNTGQGLLSMEGTVGIANSTISGTVEPKGEGSGSGGVAELPYGGVAVVSASPAARAAARSFRVPARFARQTERPAAAVEPVTTLTGSIDADNTTLHDCSGNVVDGGYNLSSDHSCHFGAPGSANAGHALLGPLADNGGPTMTLLPTKHSAAVDAIPLGHANCAKGATDQRGVLRPQGPRCDEGAVEVAQPPVVIKPNTLPDGTVGVPYHQTITATGGLGAPYTWSLAGGQLPPGLSFSAHGVIGGTPTLPGTFHFTVSVDDPTQKAYTIVITAPAGSSTAPIANTGAHVRPLASIGTWAIALGVLLLLAASWTARWARRYRRVH